jgi:hypothetical protein
MRDFTDTRVRGHLVLEEESSCGTIIEQGKGITSAPLLRRQDSGARVGARSSKGEAIQRLQ